MSVSVIQVQVLYDALGLFLTTFSEPCRANVHGQSRPHTMLGGGALILLDGSFEVLESQLFLLSFQSVSSLRDGTERHKGGRTAYRTDSLAQPRPPQSAPARISASYLDYDSQAAHVPTSAPLPLVKPGTIRSGNEENGRC